MPLAQLRPDYAPPPPAAGRPAVDAGQPAGTSPAMTLQQQLERHTSEVAGPSLERWSPRRSLAFIVTAAAALWMAILMAGAEAMHAIA